MTRLPARVALITTRGQNIGDDLVREGILHLLSSRIPDAQPLTIDKHFPATVRPEYDWIEMCGIVRAVNGLSTRLGRGFSSFLDRRSPSLDDDKILTCDILVQCGAPVYWCFDDGQGSHKNEWYDPLIRKRYMTLRGKIPFLNLGAGSCQPYRSDGAECLLNRECRDYLTELHSVAWATTVRDRIAHRIAEETRGNAPLLPCPSLFARDRLGITPAQPDFLAVNYMPGGGHYDLGQNIDAAAWQETMTVLLREGEGPFVLSCHTGAEYSAAKHLFPKTPRVLLTCAAEALRFYAKARGYIGSRVHGAMVTASFGRRAVVIGSDTRAVTLEEVGCRHHFVNDVDGGLLKDLAGELSDADSRFTGRIDSVRSSAIRKYDEILSSLDSALSLRGGR